MTVTAPRLRGWAFVVLAAAGLPLGTFAPAGARTPRSQDGGRGAAGRHHREGADRQSGMSSKCTS